MPSASPPDRSHRSTEAPLAPERLVWVIVWLTCLAGCGGIDSWRQSWQSARMPDRRLRLAGAQLPLEVVEGWAMRCGSVPFVIKRVGKVRFSHDGFRALVKGQANVACTSCTIPRFDAKDYHDAHAHVPLGWRVAWDAYALYVHPDNPVKEITVKHFRQILRTQITSWGAVGGPQEPIVLYGPPRGSRAGRVLMQVARLFFADPPWKQIADPAKIIDAVSENPLAIGMTVVGFADAAPYLALKGAIDPTARVPDDDTLEADKWPLLKTIWLWTPDPPDQAAADLIDYLYSDRGQAAIKATGYTPIPRERGAARVTFRDLGTGRPSTRPRK